MKNYDMRVLSHSRNANVVAEALSISPINSVSYGKNETKELVHDLHKQVHLGVHLVDSEDYGVLRHNGSKSSLMSDINAKQDRYMTLIELNKVVSERAIENFSRGRRWNASLSRSLICSLGQLAQGYNMCETHISRHSTHPKSMKMYHDLRKV